MKQKLLPSPKPGVAEWLPRLPRGPSAAAFPGRRNANGTARTRTSAPMDADTAGGT